MDFLLLVKARWPYGQWAHLWIEQSEFKPLLGTSCVVLGQDTQLSQCLSPPRCINGNRLIQCWVQPCVGLASHPGGSIEIPLVTSCYRNQNKLRSEEPLGSFADFIFFSCLESQLGGLDKGNAEKRLGMYYRPRSLFPQLLLDNKNSPFTYQHLTINKQILCCHASVQ